MEAKQGGNLLKGSSRTFVYRYPGFRGFTADCLFDHFLNNYYISRD